MATGVSKGATLSLIAERHGVSAEETVAFGDNPNDFSMLAWPEDLGQWLMATQKEKFMPSQSQNHAPMMALQR